MNKELCQKAFELRDAGHTFPEVGKILNLSASYARHMVEMNATMQSRRDTWTDGLPIRVARAIRNAGFTNKQDLRNTLFDSPGAFKNCKDLGKKGLVALQNWVMQSSNHA